VGSVDATRHRGRHGGCDQHWRTSRLPGVVRNANLRRVELAFVGINTAEWTT